MSGTERPTRRGLLRLGLGGLLAATGCRQTEWLGPEEPEAAEEAGTALPAAASRAEAVRMGIAALEEECRRHAGGDWARWVAGLEGYRAALRAAIAAARPNNPHAEGAYEARAAVLEARGEVPLFESNPVWYLYYLTEPAAFDALRRDKPVAAVSRWLRRQGIDLLFVPVPKMTEVYAARVAQPCPADGIVAPQIRRLQLELLQQDVEVVDLLPAFLGAADKDARPLYFPDDPHWEPRGWALAAQLVCDRLRRYEWARAARAGRRLFRATEEAREVRGVSYPALTAEQQQRVDRTRRKSLPVVRRVLPSGGGITSPDSPVLLIGDSYTAGLADQLALRLNQPVTSCGRAGHTTHGIKEAVRNREMLAGKRVVLWVQCNTLLGCGSWDLPPVVAATA